jgi:hypothetical protein
MEALEAELDLCVVITDGTLLFTQVFPSRT